MSTAALSATPALAVVEQAVMSDAIVESIGINIHAVHPTGPYGDWTRIKETISDIGFRYVRDIPDAWEKLNDLSAATGVKVCVIMQEGETLPGAIDMHLLPAVIQRTKDLTHVAFLEGPNERDGYPDWEAPLMEWHTAMYDLVKADPQLASIPILAPSIAPWGPNVLSEIGPYVDAGNFHHYTEPHPLSHNLDIKMVHAGYRAPDKPVYITETQWGSPNSGWLTDDILARYHSNGIFEAFGRGVKQTYIYQLADEIPNMNVDDLGIVKYDFTYTPTAHAMKHLIAVLSDPGAPFTPETLDYTITGGDSKLHHQLLQKRDGSFYLALWQDALLFDTATMSPIDLPAQSVTVNFATPFDTADGFAPIHSSDATPLRFGQISQLNLSVGDELMIVKLALTPHSTWDVASDGEWREAGNWQTGVPDGVDAAAYLGAAIDAPRTIVNDGPGVTLGRLGISSPHGYNIGGLSTLTMQTSGSRALIDVQNGAHRIDAPITFASDTIIQATASASLRLTGDVTLGANSSVTPGGAGAVSFEASVTLQSGATLQLRCGQQMTALTVGDGANVILPSTGTYLLRSDTVSVSTSGGKINLGKSHLITATSAGTWQDGAYTGVAGMVSAARGAGNWNGAHGITTSSPDAIAGITTLAVATAGEAGKSTFAGQSVAASDTLVMYTFNGDADLSGALDADDYFAIDSNYARSGSVFGFARGDFNYDGSIDGDDYMLIDAAYAAQAGGFTLDSTAAASSVPEPASLAVALLGVPLLALRCRRTRR